MWVQSKMRLENSRSIVNLKNLRYLLTVQLKTRSWKSKLTTKLGGQSTTLFWLSKLAWTTRFWQPWIKWLIPRDEVDVKSITGASGHGLCNEVQKPDRRDFLWSACNTPLMSASSRLDLNTNQDRNDETRFDENFNNGDFHALRLNCDRRAQAHHNTQKQSTMPFCSALQSFSWWLYENNGTNNY